MKLFFIIFAIAILIALGVTILLSLNKDSVVVTNFDECVRANYQVFDTYPKQCQSPDGDVFVEIIEDETITDTELIDFPETIDNSTCIDLCGNGVCNTDAVCAGSDCACIEDSNNCQIDCKQEVPGNQEEQPASNGNKTFENNIIKFIYNEDWDLDDNSKNEEYGLSIDIKSKISGVKKIKIHQESKDLKNVRPNNFETEHPYVISNKNGFRWKIDDDGKKYKYSTEGPNSEGVLSILVDVSEFSSKIENELALFIETIIIKDK